MTKPVVIASFLSATLTLCGAVAVVSALGQAVDEAPEYPARAVRIIVSAPPAGGPDTVARLLADKLQQRWGQPVVIENRAGAGGNLGAEQVAFADPDGTTLLAAQPAPLTTNALLYSKLNFDPAALEPVMLMTALPNALVVRADLPVDSVAELVAYAKRNPGAINYGSQGIGTTPHLSAELFSKLTGTVLTHVPYRGTAMAVNDLVAGHLDLLFMQIDAVRAQFLAGKLKMLAVATASRIDGLSQIPTMEEAGVPGFRSETWNAIAAPPKTPQPIIAKLNRCMNDALHTPEIQKHLVRLGMTPLGGTPADMAAFLKAETQRWGEVIRTANIRVK